MFIQINFVQPLPTTTRVLRYGLLACGILLLSLSVLQHNHLSQEKTSLAWQLRDLRAHTPEAMRTERFAVAAMNGDGDAREHVIAVLHKLDTPWDPLFTALEHAIDDDVVMLAVAPDAAQQSIVLRGRAADSAAAISFAERLQASPMLSDIHLLQEEPQDEATRFPLEFTISARWNTQGGA